VTKEDLKEYKHTQKWIEERLEYIEEYKARVEKVTHILLDGPSR